MTRCGLPNAVHIAQLSASDDDDLDFEEADDFEMEDERATSSAILQGNEEVVMLR